jgi:hypothetical protein
MSKAGFCWRACSIGEGIMFNSNSEIKNTKNGSCSNANSIYLIALNVRQKLSSHRPNFAHSHRCEIHESNRDTLEATLSHPDTKAAK